MIKCRICGNSESNQTFVLKEFMFHTKEEFPYIKCSKCGCMQIKKIPENIEKYYPQNYYAYNVTTIKKSFLHTILRSYVISKLTSYYLGKKNLIGFLVQYKFNKHLTWLKFLENITKSSKILDIGCGSGKLLLELNQCGFQKLTGIDLFIKENSTLQNGIKLYKQDLMEHHGIYDLIMLHHSFEHMDNPSEVFKHLFNILSPDGTLLIRIPLIDSYAWRKYGIYWFQLDAPRHFYLYTLQSIHHLSENHGFKLIHVFYDSQPESLVHSINNIKGISMKPGDFSKKMLKPYQKYTELLNVLNDGDQACLYFKKIL